MKLLVYLKSAFLFGGFGDNFKKKHRNKAFSKRLNKEVEYVLFGIILLDICMTKAVAIINCESNFAFCGIE